MFLFYGGRDDQTHRHLHGSSCYARGNAANLAAIEAFLAAEGLTRDVVLSGRNCAGACVKGPVVTIDGVAHHVMDEGALIDILQRAVSGALDKPER